MTNLRLCTYNVHGINNNKWLYLDELLKQCNIICIQEHWLMNCQSHYFTDHLEDVSVACVSAMHDDEFINGRPHGGCAIVWKNNVHFSVHNVSTRSPRLCCVKLDVPSMPTPILLACVYMPTDTMSNLLNVDEYSEVLHEMCDIADALNCEYIICMGDFNTDLSRAHSLHTQTLINFLNEESLKSFQSSDLYSVDYTFESFIDGTRSVIDHIFVSDNLYNFVTEVTCAHDIDNLSDHEPVFANLNLDLNVFDRPLNSGSKILWPKASLRNIQEYQSVVENELNRLSDTFRDLTCCRNPLCTDERHKTDALRYHDQIVDTCLLADRSIPRSNGVQRLRGIPGWRQHIQPLRDSALFWHNLWKDNGRPQRGPVADVRRHTRAKYHKAIKKAKQQEKGIRYQRMAEAFDHSDKADFWVQVKKMKGGAGARPSSIDGVTGEQAIAELFSEKYSALFNSVHSNEDDLATIKARNNELIREHQHRQCHLITANDVMRAIGKLKNNKQDGMKGLYSNHLKQGPWALVVHIARLFNCIIAHDVCPLDFCVSVMVPIPKNTKKSAQDSDNYRSIALGSILNKVLDKIIQLKCRQALRSCDYQFGFKDRHSTSQCSFVVNEIIQKFQNEGSPVYICMLDASKAFDRVKLTTLFQLLLDRSLCPLFLRLLLSQYSSQKACVQWGDIQSNYFPVKNGVKQGAVLSPTFFNVYIDELLMRLKAANAGCHIGSEFCGAFAYADDVVLLSPSVEGLRTLLGVCEAYSHSFNLLFNASKTRLIICGGNARVGNPSIVFMGKIIQTVTHEKHLGIHLGNVTQADRVSILCREMMSKCNMLHCHFPHLPPETLYFLFRSYCMPLYGLSLVNLADSSIDRLHVTWRKCIRFLLDLPPRTHSMLLHRICQDIPIEDQIYIRFIKFFSTLLLSSNPIVTLCVSLALNGSRSSISNTISHISLLTNIPRHEIPYSVSHFSLNEENFDSNEASLISDLLKMRNEHLFSISRENFDRLSLEEISFALNALCTS